MGGGERSLVNGQFPHPAPGGGGGGGGGGLIIDRCIISRHFHISTKPVQNPVESRVQSRIESRFNHFQLQRIEVKVDTDQSDHAKVMSSECLISQSHF